MALPVPRPGLVIRYDCLWLRESDAGRDQGKDRPACLVAASDPVLVPRFVVILPITHRQPSGADVGIEIPQRVCELLGLDEERSRVIVSEYNVDEWPNGGLRPIPGRKGRYAYGFIPPGLFSQIKQCFLEIARADHGVRRGV